MKIVTEEKKAVSQKQKSSFYCGLLGILFCHKHNSMFPKFESLLVVPVVCSACHLFLILQEAFPALVYSLLPSLITKDSFIVGKGYSWFSARLFSRAELEVFQQEHSQTSHLRRTLSMGSVCVRKQFWNSCGLLFSSYVPKSKTRVIVSSAVFTHRMKTTYICVTKIWLTGDFWNSRMLSVSTLNVYLS